MVDLKILPEMVICDMNMTAIAKDQQQHQPCLVTERHFIKAPFMVSWIPLIDTRIFLQRGTSLGYITDMYGHNITHEVEAPIDGLLLIRFELPPVVKGDTLAVMAVLNKYDLVCGHLKQSINNGSSTNGKGNVNSNSNWNTVKTFE
jgi:hypothetical protein